MSKIKGIKIDVVKKEIYLVEVEQGLQGMHAQLDCEYVEMVRVDHNEALWIDEEGLLKDAPIGAFKITIHPQVMSGHGLILGLTFDGDNCDTKLSVEQVKAMVTFVGVDRVPEPRMDFHTFNTSQEFEEFLNQKREPDVQDN